MTSIHYNGVELRDCETKSFEQTIEYDESNTDVIFSKFRIRVASTLTVYSNTPHENAISVNGASVVDRAAELHARLNEARKDFWMVLQGAPSDDVIQYDEDGNPTNVQSRVLLIAAGSVNGEMQKNPEASDGDIARINVVDCANGPKPISVKITQIFGGRAMRVEFEIEVCRKMCVSGVDYSKNPPVLGIDSSGTAVLNNRWYLTESQDEAFVTTKTYQGTLRVSHSSVWPHYMRYLCVPPLLDGYKRMRQEYVDDPTGLILKYRIEDRQHHASAPWPVTKWHGTHSESTTANGTVQAASVHISLTGPMHVPKRLLIGVAGKMLLSRLHGLVKENPQSAEETYETYLRNLAIIDHMDRPTIEMKADVKYTTSEYKWLSMRIEKIGQPLGETVSIDGYNPLKHPVPLQYDSEKPAGIFSCYLQNPCSPWHDMPLGIFPGQEDLYSRTRTGDSNAYEYKNLDPLELSSGSSVRDDDASIYLFPYTMYNLTNRYVTDRGYRQLPLAAPQADPTADTCAIVRMHNGVCRRVLTVEAIRTGLWPLLPAPKAEITDHNGIREVLADTDISTSAPQIGADGASRSFALLATYTYMLSRPPSAIEKLRGGALPTEGFGPAANVLDLSAHTDTMAHLQWEPAEGE